MFFVFKQNSAYEMRISDWSSDVCSSDLRFDYAIEQVFEAGIALQGTEVKSLRFGEGTIAESYAEVKGNEVWLINSNIPEFSHGNRHNHEPRRPRKLLLNGREITKLHAGVIRQGMRPVPRTSNFNT